MTRSYRRRILHLIVIFTVCTSLLLSTPLAAQEAEMSPIVQMLRSTPDNAESRDFLSYVDYERLVATRPGAIHPTTYEEYLQLNDAADERVREYNAAIRGSYSGPDLSYLFSYLQDAPRLLGIEFFDIDQGMTYGQPPRTVTLFQGEFDTSSVRSAYLARNYKEESLNDLLLFCGENGCEGGTILDLAGREPGDPFGGQLGQQQPVLLVEAEAAPTQLISSRYLESLEATANTIAADEMSLIDDPSYAAAVAAISNEGILLQAQFIAPRYLIDLGDPAAMLGMTPDEIEALIESLDEAASEFEPLPFYSLAVLADTVVGDEQVALAGLVYPNIDYAETAAALLPTRIENYTSRVAGQSLTELLSERGASFETTTYTDDETGFSVALVQFRAPLLPEADDTTPPPSSSLVFNLLARGFGVRDLGWLSPQLVQP